MIDKVPNYSVLYDGKSSYKEPLVNKDRISTEEQLKRMSEFKLKSLDLYEELKSHYNEFPNRNLSDAMIDMEASLKAINTFIINLN